MPGTDDPPAKVAATAISVRGARTHNLKNVDLDIPRGRLTVFCGVSGSGKTSMALDTLYAEGQRRFVETFSAYSRQFLHQLDRPPVEEIKGLPAAIALTRHEAPRSSRSTVASVSEIGVYFQMLLSSVHVIVCPRCGNAIDCDTPESAARSLTDSPPNARMIIGFETAERFDRDTLIDAGFVRAIDGGRMIELTAMSLDSGGARSTVVVDRVRGDTEHSRVVEAFETAYEFGSDRAVALVENAAAMAGVEIDGRRFAVHRFSGQQECSECGLHVPSPDPRLLDFNSPLGACPECEGFGSVSRIDPALVVPDATRSLRDGAIAPWRTPAYAHELEELIELADDYKVPLDVPYAELTDAERAIVWEGVPERDFGGLQGFFRWLDDRRYKMHLRVFLSRWRSYQTCDRCRGARLRDEALAYQFGGRTMADWLRLEIHEAHSELATVEHAEWQNDLAAPIVAELKSRLGYLAQVGVGYLPLDRPLRTLSSGELQRVALTSALGSSLVDMLYVFDEPTAGLHRNDVPPLTSAIHGLRDRGNTVLVVEHEQSMLAAADWAIEFGPRAGSEGGSIVSESTPRELAEKLGNGTGDWLSGRRAMLPTREAPRRSNGVLQLLGARGNNLQQIDVEFPLGVMCVVTGVSGAGKSSLVAQTLYPALRGQLETDAESDEPQPLPFDDLLGSATIDEVVWMDQSPVARSPRSNAATYIKAFDTIRQLMAAQPDAQARGLAAGHFSFNVADGRCESCQGAGFVEVDMHFMADMTMTCQECGGRRYRDDVLDVQYRGRNIAEILEMTVYEAFRFFRGENKLQARLKTLVDVGLDYLPLGQPASTLSGGESQRLKLAGHLNERRRNRTLFIIDEPSVGLHFSDVAKLIDCLDALVDVGHSLIIIEHNLQMILAADHVIDVGPGPADRGGRIVATGPPRSIARCAESATGSVLADYYRRMDAQNSKDRE